MRGIYHGLPAAASVEQAIALAQLLIVRDLERRTTAIPERADYVDNLRRNEGSHD
jgi:hypothetical protein